METKTIRKILSYHELARPSLLLQRRTESTGFTPLPHHYFLDLIALDKHETDAYRSADRCPSNGKPTSTGRKTDHHRKNTSEGGKNFIRKESGPHPNKTKNTLKDKSPTLTGNNSYPTGKKRKGYTLYTRTEKYAPGTLVELNTADTTILKKVPGIGSTFARRIMKYRELLGGFYDVSQLAEVYGIDEERYQALAPWFIADTLHVRRLEVNALPAAALRKHPYLDYRQAKAIEQLRKQKAGSPDGRTCN